MNGDLKIISPHGGYQKLKSYQMAEIVYDATVKFCGRFIDRRSRTVDQMVQAARSGKQNIAEGSMASGTSKKTELKLVRVARGKEISCSANSKRNSLRKAALPNASMEPELRRASNFSHANADKTPKCESRFASEHPSSKGQSVF